MGVKVKAVFSLFALLLDLILFVVFLIASFIPVTLLIAYKWALVKGAKWFFHIELIPFDGLFNGGIDTMSITFDKGILVRDEDNRRPGAKLCQNAGSLISYEGPPLNVEHVRAFFWEKFLKEVLEAKPDEVKREKYLNLCAYFVKVGGHMFRRRMDKESFDLSAHIFEVTLKENESVEDFCGEMLTTPYKPQSPLWRVVLLTKPAMAAVGSQPEFHILMTIHHSIADGFTFCHILEQLTGKEIICTFAPEVEVPIVQRVRSALKAPRASIIGTYHGLCSLTNKTLKCPRDLSNRLTFGSFPLNKLTAIRRKTGASVHTILQTVLAALLYRLHKSRGVAMPKALTSGILLPWPRHPYKSRMCNWFTLGYKRLPLKNTDTTDRLVKIHNSFQDDLICGFETSCAPAAAYMASLMPLTPWDKTSAFQANWSPIFVGDPIKIFNDKRVTNWRIMIGLFGYGMYMGISSITYKGQVNYTINGGRQLYSQQQLEQLKIWMDEELENLLKMEIRLDS